MTPQPTGRSMLFLAGAAIGFMACAQVPVVNYLFETALVLGFLYQMLAGGVVFSLIAGGGFALGLYLASQWGFLSINGVMGGTYFLEIAVAGMLLGWGIRQRWPAFRTLGVAVLPSLAVWLLLLFNAFDLATHFYGPLESLERIYSETMAQRDINQAPDQLELYDKVMAFSRMVFPATNFVSSVLNLFIIYLLVQVGGKRWGVYPVRLPPLSQWQLRFFWVWILAASLLLALWGTPILRKLGANAMICLGFLFAAEGLAVIRHYFRSRQSSPWLEYSTYFILYVTKSISPIVVGLLGLFDLWFNFRKLNTITPIKEKGTV